MKTMKKYMLYCALFAMFGLGACFDDGTTVATDETMIGDIVIGELRDTTAVAYATVLEITPNVADNPAYSYAWYAYGGSLPTDNGYRTVKIASEKTLSYAVELPQGSYTLVFEVTDTETGYTVVSEMDLQVTTAFSQGFYILKGMDGNTELDLYDPDNGELRADILSMTRGEALSGEPQALDVLYCIDYTDPSTAAASTGTAIFVAHGMDGMACLRTTDLAQVFDRSTILFSEDAGGEVPYRMATTMSRTFYFTDSGMRSSSSSTGKMGYPEGNGASRFFQASNGTGFTYWDETNHQLNYTNGNTVTPVEYYGSDIDWDEVKPVATGWNHLAGVNTLWYIFENATGFRWLVLLDKNAQVADVRPLDASLHIAQSSIIASNALTASTIYSVHGNVLWQYSIDGDEENVNPIVLEGIGMGEEITFLSDIFFKKQFDYIVVGTQSGSSYAVYMYEIQGGQPYGVPVHVVRGEGTLKQVRFVSQDDDERMNYYAFTNYAVTWGMGPDYPY